MTNGGASAAHADKMYTYVKYGISIGSVLVSLAFAYRSFYGMRIDSGK